MGYAPAGGRQVAVGVCMGVCRPGNVPAHGGYGTYSPKLLSITERAALRSLARGRAPSLSHLLTLKTWVLLAGHPPKPARRKRVLCARRGHATLTQHEMRQHPDRLARSMPHVHVEVGYVRYMQVWSKRVWGYALAAVRRHACGVRGYAVEPFW